MCRFIFTFQPFYPIFVYIVKSKNIMKKLFIMLVGLVVPFFTLMSQTPSIPVGDNIVAEGLPAIPVSIIQEVRPYIEARAAGLMDWHPAKNEMVISTRFANVPQLHYLKMAGGARKQLTFEGEPISFATFEPNTGAYLLLGKDIGGNVKVFEKV